MPPKSYPNSLEPYECAVPTTALFLMTSIYVIPSNIILISSIKQAPCFIHLCTEGHEDNQITAF